MRLPLLSAALLMSASFMPLLAVEKPAVAETAPAKTIKAYPLTTCVVSGDTLGGSMGDAVVYDHEGREVRFCCKGCIDDFTKDPAKYLAKIDEAEKAAKPADAKAETPKATPKPAAP